MVRYHPRAQDLRAASSVLACYGFKEQADAMWEESYQHSNDAPSMGPRGIASMLAEEGVPCHVMLFRPIDFEMLLTQPELNSRPVLLGLRGLGGQGDPFFCVAVLNPDLGAKFYLNLPTDFDLVEVPDAHELCTGVVVVPHDKPPAIGAMNPQDMHE
jgi:hypothetical protein